MPILCLLSWPIHTCIELSNASFFYRSGDRDVMIRCVPAEGAMVFSYTSQDLSWMSGGDLIQRYRVNAVGDGWDIPIRYIYSKNNEDKFLGVMDTVRYTRVELCFEVPSLEYLDECSKDIKTWAGVTVQRFIDLYRIVSNDGRVSRIKMSDVPIFDVAISTKYTFDKDEVNAEFRPTKRWLQFNQAVQGGHLKKENPIAEDVLQQKLRSGTEVRLFERLLLDAKEQAFIHQDYDLCIVVVETAFEAFLQQRLQWFCEYRGIATLARNGKQVEYGKAIEKGHVKNDLIRWVKELCGINVAESTEHGAWHRDTYEPRNAIVHRGRRGATDVAAQAAFQGATQFIALLERALA